MMEGNPLRAWPTVLEFDREVLTLRGRRVKWKSSAHKIEGYHYIYSIPDVRLTAEEFFEAYMTWADEPSI